jgi:MoxR-like ATPase
MTVQTLPSTAHPVAVTLNTMIDEVSAKFLERRHVIVAIILGVLAKQHVSLLGPPGTAKSALCREIFRRFIDALYFEALLSKTRPAEAILGPYDIPQLRDHGDLHRKYAGFLPSVNFAMLDEWFKMSPTLGHDLLSVLLERRLHQVNGGRSWIDCPLYSCIGGTNELPEGDDAAALYDRVLVRVIVDYLQESGNFAAMLTGDLSPVPGEATVDFKDLADVIDNVVPGIGIPLDVQEAILRLRDNLHALEIVPSDRRWKQSMSLLQASAFLQGRDQVEEDDIQVLRYALWDTPVQVQQVERATLSVANPAAEAAMALLDDIEEIARGIRDVKGQSSEARGAYGTEANGKLKLILTDLQQKRQEMIAAGRSTTKLDEVADKLAAVKRSLYVDLLDMDPSVLK